MERPTSFREEVRAKPELHNAVHPSPNFVQATSPQARDAEPFHL